MLERADVVLCWLPHSGGGGGGGGGHHYNRTPKPDAGDERRTHAARSAVGRGTSLRCGWGRRGGGTCVPLFTKIGRLSIFGSVQFSRAKRFSLLHGEGRRGGGGGGSGGEYGGRPASDAVRRPFRKGGDGYGSAMRFSRAAAAACVYVCIYTKAAAVAAAAAGDIEHFIYEYTNMGLIYWRRSVLRCSGALVAGGTAVTASFSHRTLPPPPLLSNTSIETFQSFPMRAMCSSFLSLASVPGCCSRHPPAAFRTTTCYVLCATTPAPIDRFYQ